MNPYSLALAATTARAAELQLRAEMHECDQRLRARYGERVIEGRDARALVTPRGRVIAPRPDGWAGGERVGAGLGRPGDAPGGRPSPSRSSTAARSSSAASSTSPAGQLRRRGPAAAARATIARA